MRRTAWMFGLVLMTAACGGGGTTSTTETPTTGVPDTTSTTTVAETTTTTEGTSGFDAALTSRTWAVVLVTPGDVLNVRSGPGASNPVVHTFGPTATGIVATGNWSRVGDARWIEVNSASGTGWANKFYLTEEWTTPEVIALWNMGPKISELGTAMAANADLGGPVSSRGLHVAFFDPTPLRWTQQQLETVMHDPTLIGWAYPGCGGPGECGEKTFAEEIGARFVSVQQDIGLDTIVMIDDVELGGNGYPSLEAMIPTVFKNFHFVGLKDPGDDPSYTGMDWFIWLVFFEMENGEPRIVGLAPDMWSP